jgi:hypothetical protein
MKQDIGKELARLGRMTVGELRERYRAVFGEETRSGNKDFLRKRIGWRIQALAEGGLSERAHRRAEELANDADLRIRPPRGLCGGGPQRSPCAVALPLRARSRWAW